MKKIKALFILAGIILLFVAIGAFYAAIGFILKPDGSYLDMSVALLEDSPFDTYLIPGIVLLLVNGLGSVMASLLAFRRSVLTGKVTVILGVFLILWIFAQLYWIGYQNILQVVFFIVGIIEIILGWILMKYWNRPQSRFV